MLSNQVKMKLQGILKKIGGAEGGSRTRTSFRTTDFKSGAPALRSLTKRYEAGYTGDAVM
jgi:hypothetical protein